MESSNSSSDEENFEVGFWNNWLPSSTPVSCQIQSMGSNQLNRTREGVRMASSRTTSLRFISDHRSFGNWVPPDHFLSTSLKKTQNITLKKMSEQSHNEKQTLLCDINGSKEIEEVSDVRKMLSDKISLWRKDLNLNWGKRVQLHDVTKFNDADLTWGIVNLGIFANIRLWANEYGNICGSANGKISKLGSSEVTFISIKSAQLLRKMLSLSSAQWASLCETVQETKASLNFDAFEVSELTRKNSLEKLWFFICKRRHCLPDQCMLVKLCGAVKCLQKFRITTKLIVQDIRSTMGEPISD